MSGGGKSKPVILSSELTGKKPELKLEVQSPKPTAAAKKAAVKKKAVAKKDNKKEMAAQKKCTTDQKARFTAEALKAKADAMQKKISKVKADGARSLARDTQGSKKNMMVAKEAAKEAATMQQKIKEKSEQIKSTAKANMEKALIASGTTGIIRANKKKQLQVQMTAEINKKIQAMKAKEVTAAKTKQLNQVSTKLQKKKAEISKQTAARIAKASAASSKLTGAEKSAVASKVKASCATIMAKWRLNGGKGSPNSGKGKAAKQAAKKGQAAVIRSKVTAKTKADIVSEVEKKVPGALKLKVDGKVAEAVMASVNKIKTKLTAAARAKRARDTAAQTAGKSDQIKRRITADVNRKSEAKLKLDILAATNASSMKALKAKLAGDLTTELKPAVTAEITRKVTADKNIKAEKRIANKSKDAGRAASAMARASVKKPKMLDIAESFAGEGGPQSAVSELED